MGKSQLYSLLAHRVPVWGRRTAVGVVFVAASVICVYRIGARSMWLDELSHRDIGMMPIGRLMNDPTLSVQPSHGYYLIHRFSEWVCGDMDVGNRLPEALSAIVSVLLTYVIGRHLFSTGAGLLAAGSLLANSLFVRYAQENRFYQMGSMGFLLVYYTFMRFLETRSVKHGIWFVVAASFALRTHSYGMVTVSAAALVGVLLIVASYVGARYTPYDIRGAMIGRLALAGVCIAVLWLPYPLRIGQFLSASKNAPAFDGFWTAPFSLSPWAILRYMFDQFIPIDPMHKRWYAIPLVAAVLGSIGYRRGRFLVFLVFFLAATLPVIYAMNNARAAVMPKRVLYFLPVLMIWAAGGLSMLAAGARSLVRAGLSLVKWMPKGAVHMSAAVVSLCVWVMVLKIYVAPVVSSGATGVSQLYYEQWRVTYREIAALLTLHARPGEGVWWYPPVNDAWLCERYMSPSAGVSIALKHAHDITRDAMHAALKQVPGLWVYGVDVTRLGLPPLSYITINVGKNKLFLVRREYATDADKRAADAEMLWRSMLNISAYPEVDCLDDLVKALQARGQTNMADRAVTHLHAYPRAAYAVAYAVNYWTNRGEYVRAYELQKALADRHPWESGMQLDAARGALLARRPAEALRYARRIWPGSPHMRASRYEIAAEAYRAASRYGESAAYYERAMRIRRGLRTTPATHLEALSQARQTCLARAGDDAGVLMAWLDGWTISADLHRMFAFTNVLSEVMADKERMAGFHAHVRRSKRPYQFVPTFVQWYVGADRTNEVSPAVLSRIRRTVHARTWPLYCYFMEHAPTNAAKAALIPPEELPKRGFDLYEFWDNALIWSESFYLRHGGLEMALRYWDTVNAVRSNMTGVAAINQAKLEYQHGQYAACITRVRTAHQAIRAAEWMRQRAVDMLVRMTNAHQDASLVLVQYEDQPSK